MASDHEKKVSPWGHKYELTVSYDIPASGIYEHDLLVAEIAGEKARETSWGTVMFRYRIISYAFENAEDLAEAKKRFEDWAEFFRAS